jgi:hypothetical protein
MHPFATRLRDTRPSALDVRSGWRCWSADWCSRSLCETRATHCLGAWRSRAYGPRRAVAADQPAADGKLSSVSLPIARRALASVLLTAIPAAAAFAWGWMWLLYAGERPEASITAGYASLIAPPLLVALVVGWGFTRKERHTRSTRFGGAAVDFVCGATLVGGVSLAWTWWALRWVSPDLFLALGEMIGPPIAMAATVAGLMRRRLPWAAAGAGVGPLPVIAVIGVAAHFGYTMTQFN